MSDLGKEKKKVSTHIPHVTELKSSTFQQIIKSVFYDFVMLFANIVVYTFFREVSVRGSFNLPKTGATIVVVAPHANQFVDGAVILSQIRAIANRNSRPIIAESSYKERFIGSLARLASAIPVPRAQDNLKFVDGEIFINGDDFSRIFGRGTDFTKLEAKGLLGLPESAGNAEIQEIVSETEIVLKKPFRRTSKSEYLLKEGTKYKYAAKISTDETFQHVFNALHNKGVITIFPEGGSHDRLELLPIKAGFAIMALGAVAADPSQPVNIVPTGLNYFHRNKFRSRAVVEFGTPIRVTAEHGKLYKENAREAVSKLLDEVTVALKSVTLTAPDYETLMVIQAARRLYAQKLPLSLVVEMNRKLITGYTHYKDHPRIIQLKKNVIQYNKKLKQLGLRDHQVEVAARNSLENSGILLFRVLKLLFLFSLSLPGTILFGPIFIVTDHIARKKQKLALAKSVVKVKAVDVIATWKIIVATIFAPTLYITYSIIGTYLIKNYNILGLENLGTFQLLVLSYLVLVLTTYAAFRIGEIGVDILKSLPPLMHAVFGSNKELSRLKKTKENLQMEITEIVNDLGPKLFPEFDKFTRAKDQDDHGEELETRGRSSKPSEVERGDDHMRSISTSSATSVSSIGLSRVTSEGYLSDIPILGDGWRNNDYYRSSSSSSSDLDDIYKKSGGTGTEKESKTSTKLRKLMRERIQAEDNDE